MFRWLLFVAALTLALPPAGSALAQSFGATDIETVFYVDKSDDRNRVDYGMRVGADCQPRGESPMFAYWRRFEPGQEPLGELNAMDRRVYGIQSQDVSTRSPTGSWVEMRLAGLPESRILVLIVPRSGGSCTARARSDVRGVELILDHIHVQLGGLIGIDFVTVVGEEIGSGRQRRIRLTPGG